MPIYKVEQAETERRSFTRKQHVQITLDRHNDAQFTVFLPDLRNFSLPSTFKEKKKRRGPKGPNPLSCKKKKKNNQQPLPRPTEQQINEAKKRKRRSKKKTAGDNYSPAVAV
jgi:hypothetical protein